MKEHIAPEALDIWKDENGRRFTIIETTHKYIYVASKKLRGRGITIKTFTHNKIKNDWLYLGKSKANIEQFFEVEDNGRCIEDNTPHAESTVLFNDLENEDGKVS